MADLVWTRPALEQLYELIAPISEEDPEMGASLVDRIEEGVERLKEFPESAPVVRRQIRAIMIHKLPYRCYYRYEADIVRIISITHTRQQEPEL